jgi:hypothetical protein
LPPDDIGVGCCFFGIFCVFVGRSSEEIRIAGINREIVAWKILIRKRHNTIHQGSGLIEVSAYGFIPACVGYSHFYDIAGNMKDMICPQDILTVEAWNDHASPPPSHWLPDFSDKRIRASTQLPASGAHHKIYI